jgi:hypothetical protein
MEGQRNLFRDTWGRLSRSNLHHLSSVGLRVLFLNLEIPRRHLAAVPLRR